jgi:hypothetical protein
MSDRGGLLDAIAVAISGAPFPSARSLARARAVLAVPKIAAALDLADRMRDAETVVEWGARYDEMRSPAFRQVGEVYEWSTERDARLSVQEIGLSAGVHASLVRRTVTTLRGPWEDA